MYRHKTPQQQKKQDDLTLYKFKSNYDKVIKDMHETPKEYEAIKALVEEKTHSLANIENNINKKSKNNLQINSHKKMKK